MLCLPAAAFATPQQPDGPADTAPRTVSAEQVMTNARLVYAVRPPRRDPCPPEQEGVIVVCRRLEDPESQRVPGTIDEAIEADAPVPDGLPRAPDLFGIPDGGVSVAGGCFFPPCPPPTAIMIDLKALPEPPPGSDAAAYGYQPPARAGTGEP